MAQNLPPPLTPAPEPVPQRGDRTTFSNRVDAFVTWLTANAIPEIAAICLNAYNNAVDAYNNALAAAASAAAAATSANNATMAPGTNATSTTSNTIGTGTKNFTIQTAKNFAAGQFVVAANTTTPANYMFGQINSYDSGNGALAVRVISTGGSGTFGAWTVSQSSSSVYTLPSMTGKAGQILSNNGVTEEWVTSPAASIAKIERTSNTILNAEDNSSWIDITSGTFTQTFSPASTLGADWFVYYSNSGTGDVTIDPSELIDGLSSFIMYPGEVRVIETDGIEFFTIILNSFTRVFTANGTFVKPPGYGVFEGDVWSAGASGQKTNATNTASYGGCGGGHSDFRYLASQLAASESIIVGTGGPPVTAATIGNPGGFSAIGTLIKVYGGTANVGGSVMSEDGINPLGTDSGLFNAVGYEGARKLAPANLNSLTGNSAHGGAAMSAHDNTVTAGGGSVWGGTAGGSIRNNGTVRAPGNSTFGGKGGIAATTTNGSAGAIPGGGGGATQTGPQSGAGARGEVRIWGIL